MITLRVRLHHRLFALTQRIEENGLEKEIEEFLKANLPLYYSLKKVDSCEWEEEDPNAFSATRGRTSRMPYMITADMTLEYDEETAAKRSLPQFFELLDK